MNSKSSPSASVLRVSAVNAHRGSAHVLHDLSFDVPRGQVTALMGRNGVGKTSTLLAILGLISASGSIVLNGQELVNLTTERRVGHGIGFVPEEREVFTRLTVAENLRLAERSRSPRYDLVYDVFPILLERGEQLAGTLSGGQQQMLALGRGLLNENSILLVDEPTKGLAPVIVSQVVDALARAKKEATILLVEQNVSVAARLADHVVVIDQGTVVHRDAMSTFSRESGLARRWLGVDVSTGTDGASS